MVDRSVAEVIERFVEAELTGRRHAGSGVSLVEGAEVTWARGFGHANIEKGVEATPDTVFRCASVTKPVVTVGFLQLMERGKFGLDDEVNSHLDVKIRDVKGGEPTIRDLMTHRSGMPTRVPPLWLMDEEPLSMREYIGEAARMAWPRGERWAYCNTAYMIMGYLIGLFSGEGYDEYVAKHVLEPLGMKSTTFTLTSGIEGRVAQGYKRAGGPGEPLIPVAPYILGTMPEDAAGSMYSTVLDLGRFVSMNMNGGAYKGKRVLKEETVREMQRLQAPSGRSRSGMGLTWFRSVHDGRVMLNHTGGLPDYANNVCFYPELRLGVCWLSNTQDGSGWRPPSPTVLRMALGHKPSADFGALQAVHGDWERVVGVYGDEGSQHVVRYVNGFLTLDGSQFLERVDETRFTVHGPSSDGYEFTVEFGEEHAEMICLGTGEMPLYAPEPPAVDEEADVGGVWRGEYYDSAGFHTVEMNVAESSASVTVAGHEPAEVEGYAMEAGRVSGSFLYVLPPEYARWGTRDQVEVGFELYAQEGKLKGFLRPPSGAIRVELERAA